MVGRSISAPNPAWARSSLTLISSIKSIEIQKRAKITWQPGDVLAWRGIYRKRVWHAQTVLDLDLIINPDFSFEWKDLGDYQKAIDNGIIFPEWTLEIDEAVKEILDRLEKRQYPYDESWLNWLPDPSWSPPKLPENWDKI
jgi:hypothetical protein